MKKMSQDELVRVLKAARTAWFYNVLLIFVWIGFEIYNNGRPSNIQVIIFLSQFVVFSISKAFFERK